MAVVYELLGNIRIQTVVIGIALLGACPLIAQETGGATANRLRVSLDCTGRSCDLDQYRSLIDWVNWETDPADADVRVTLTGTPAAQGGFDYSMEFTVADDFAAAGDSLSFTSAATDSDQDEIAGIATTLSIGFARYAMIAGYRDFVAIRAAANSAIDPRERILAPQEVDDPWNLWVFTIGGSGNISGTDTRTTRRVNTNFSASRTTPTWKLSFSGRGTINTQEIERSDGSIFKSDERDATVNIGITYALADHWSLNLSSLSARLPRFNQKFRSDITPGIEYSLFPYEQATRRSLTFRYTMALTYRKYFEETIFGRTEETPWEQGFLMRGTMRQPWGDASASATVSHILDDIDKHNISLRASVSFRIVRGLSFNTGGDISWVTDQVYLSAGGVTDEEALLRLRTRQSDFNKGLNFGLSYQFGSIYNNTVNTRFPGAGGGGGGGDGGGRGGGGGGRGGPGGGPGGGP